MRLVDADALKENCDIKLGNDTIGKRQYVMFHEIDDAPTIDAVEVVRCEDCRYRNTWDNPRLEPQYYKCGMGVKFRDYGYVREDDYCSLGKRREGGGA